MQLDPSSRCHIAESDTVSSSPSIASGDYLYKRQVFPDLSGWVGL